MQTELRNYGTTGLGQSGVKTSVIIEKHALVSLFLFTVIPSLVDLCNYDSGPDKSKQTWLLDWDTR